MQALGLRHAQQLNAALAPLYAQPPAPAALFDQLAAALRAVFGAEAVCFDRFDGGGRMAFLGASPQHLFTPELLALAAPRMAQHPLFGEVFERRNPVPLKISDLCPTPKFLGSLLYCEFYRPVAVSHQLVAAVTLPGGDLLSCAVFRARRDFTEAERTLLAFVRPHLPALLQLAQAAAQPPAAPDRLTDALGLTPREAEVLGHLAQGCEDKEIARRCGISPRTVQVHLRSVYAKLGVVNRTAASLRVARLVGVR